jgi:hypothetical protein
MSITLSVVLNLARSYLNDDNSTTWTDVVLIPKAQEAWRELCNKLWTAGCGIMRTRQDPGAAVLVSASGTATDVTNFVAASNAMQNPIAMWENTNPVSQWIPMTEIFNLPTNYAPVATMIYWCWRQERLIVAPCLSDRNVIASYRPIISLPKTSSDIIYVPFAELYMGARTAAIAAGAVGNAKVFAALSAKAKTNLAMVILANRGQQKPSSKP